MGLFDSIKNGFKNFGKTVGDIFNKAKQGISSAANSIGKTAGGLYGDAKSATKSVYGDIKSMLSTMGNAGIAAGNKLIDAESNLLGGIGAGAKGLGEGAGNLLGSPITLLLIGGVALFFLMKK